MPTRGRFSIFPYLLVAGIIGGSFLLSLSTALAFTFVRANELQIGTDPVVRIKLFDKKFSGGSTIAVDDLDQDGFDEYVVGAGPTGGPQIQIYRHDLTLRRSFFAFDGKMTDGVTVAAGDLDGDGISEIVVGPQPGYNAIVGVYSPSGQKIRTFTVFESSFAGGVDVAVIPAQGQTKGFIVVGSGFGREAGVQVYDAQGKSVVAAWSPLGKDSSNGVHVAAGWSTTYGEPVVVVGAGAGEKPIVQVYGVQSKRKLAQWLAYDERVRTGVTVGWRQETIVTGPGPGGGPNVKTFGISGTLLTSAMVYEREFRGGLRVAASAEQGLVVPVVVPTTENTTAAGEGKSILINLTKQELQLIEKGRVVSIRKISSGKWSTPTPVGDFRIKNKIPVAYSKAYGLYMENWMAITPDGKIGLHALPFWKLKGGRKLYEGAAHIGTPVSHGCIRQTLVEAKSLYDWAPIGTPVKVVK